MKEIFKQSRRYLAVLLLLMVTLTGVQPIASVKADTERFTMKTTIGYDDRQEVDVHVPITVEVTNNGSDFDGSIQVTVPGRDGNIMYEQPLTLAKGATKKVQLAPMFYVQESQIRVALVNKKGKVLYSQEPYINVSANRNNIRVGILSDDYAVNRLFDNKRFITSYYSDLILRTVELGAEDIPESGEAMDSLDVLVITNFSTDVLSDKQVKAIESWVNNGGLLMVGTGDSYKKTLEGLKDFLTFKDKGLIEVNTEFGGYEAQSIINGLDVFDSYSPLDVQNFVNTHPWELQFLMSDIDRILYQDMCNEIDKAVAAGVYVDLSGYFNKIWQQAWYSFGDNFYYTNYWTSDENHFTDTFKELFYSAQNGIYEFNYLKFQNYCKQVVFNAVLYKYIFETLGYPADQYYSFTTPDNDGLFDDIPHSDFSYVDATIWDFDFSDSKISGQDKKTGEAIDLFESKEVGRGHVVMAAMDFSKNPFVTFLGADTILLSVIENKIALEMMDRYRNYDPNPWSWGYGNGSNPYKSLLDKLNANRTVPAIVYFVVFAVYIAACFILFNVLKKKKKSLLLWPIIAGAALVTSGLVFLLSFSTKATKPVMNGIRVVDASDTSGVVDCYTTITMPSNKIYKVMFAENLSTKYIETSSGWGYNPQSLSSYSVAFTEKDGRQGFIFNNSSILSKKAVIVTENNFKHGDIEFVGEYLGGPKTGSVTNNYGYDLYDCCIILDYCIIPLGTVKNGETIDIASLPAKGTSDNMYYRSSDDIVRETLFGKVNGADRVLGFYGKDIVKDNARFSALSYVAELTGIDLLTYYWGNTLAVGPAPDYLPLASTDRLVFVGFNNRTGELTESGVTEIITEVVYKEANR